jgi:hypothetical protein
MLGSVCCVKRFHVGGKHFTDDEKVETEVRNWLRQQQDFYAAGFDALAKRWDKCISVGGEYVETEMFFSGSNITCFIPICDLFTYSPSYYRQHSKITHKKLYIQGQHILKYNHREQYIHSHTKLKQMNFLKASLLLYIIARHLVETVVRVIFLTGKNQRNRKYIWSHQNPAKVLTLKD